MIRGKTIDTYSTTTVLQAKDLISILGELHSSTVLVVGSMEYGVQRHATELHDKW